MNSCFPFNYGLRVSCYETTICFNYPKVVLDIILEQTCAILGNAGYIRLSQVL